MKKRTRRKFLKVELVIFISYHISENKRFLSKGVITGFQEDEKWPIF